MPSNPPLSDEEIYQRSQFIIEEAEFQPWLQKRFAVNTSASWAKIILFYSTDESHAFDSFFDLLEKFIKEKYSLDKVDNHKSAVLILD